MKNIFKDINKKLFAVLLILILFIIIIAWQEISAQAYYFNN